jgi:hypothetical protein
MADLANRIDSYFIEMEWPFERIDEHLWRTAFPGDIQVHEVFVSTDEPSWLSFRSPVTKAPQGKCAPKLFEHLLRLNALIPLTKFCVMENHDVFAMLDLPTEDLDFSEFRTALLTLVNHVDAYDNEIVKICADEAHVSSLAAR